MIREVRTGPEAFSIRRLGRKPLAFAADVGKTPYCLLVSRICGSMEARGVGLGCDITRFPSASQVVPKGTEFLALTCEVFTLSPIAILARSQEVLKDGTDIHRIGPPTEVYNYHTGRLVGRAGPRRRFVRLAAGRPVEAALSKSLEDFDRIMEALAGK